MVDLLYPCVPSPGSFVWLWEFVLIPSGSPLNLAGRFIHIWASYGYLVEQVIWTSWKPSLCLCVCMLGSTVRALHILRSLLVHLTCTSSHLHLAGTKVANCNLSSRRSCPASCECLAARGACRWAGTICQGHCGSSCVASSLAPG